MGPLTHLAAVLPGGHGGHSLTHSSHQRGTPAMPHRDRGTVTAGRPGTSAQQQPAVAADLPGRSVQGRTGYAPSIDCKCREADNAITGDRIMGLSVSRCTQLVQPSDKNITG